MLTESLLALAAAGGTAVAQAAGTEAWGTVSEGVARMFRRRSGRGSEDEVLRDLEGTALVRAADDAEGSRRRASLWQRHFAALLSDADDQVRQQAETELRHLISLVPGVADRYQVLNIHGNTYDKSPQQYGSHNHQQFHYGSDT
ncbi:hypothetical protein [Streptomyces sp. B27]|uniref:hypothetical protein n=1 Tax=Streptomyces TaxID=1883 RepID=UPI000FD744CB|nr:hypothetical protein [Streptomyces sp. B27]